MRKTDNEHELQAETSRGAARPCPRTGGRLGVRAKQWHDGYPGRLGRDARLGGRRLEQHHRNGRLVDDDVGRRGGRDRRDVEYAAFRPARQESRRSHLARGSARRQRADERVEQARHGELRQREPRGLRQVRSHAESEQREPDAEQRAGQGSAEVSATRVREKPALAGFFFWGTAWAVPYTCTVSSVFRPPACSRRTPSFTAFRTSR